MLDLAGLDSPTAAVTQADEAGALVLFAKLVDVAPDGSTTLVHRLVSPVRVPEVGKPYRIELPGIVHRFDTGHRLQLVLAGSDAAYGRNAVDPGRHRRRVEGVRCRGSRSPRRPACGCLAEPAGRPVPLPCRPDERGSTVEFQLQPTATPVDAEARAQVLADPAFGRVFTDHMVSVQWTREQGWHDAALLPYGPLSVDPANVVLHYGQEVFEGMKAYRQPDGGVALFRPDRNAARMVRSCTRLALPVLPEDVFVAACELLVRTDAAWVPDGEGASLYLRPFMFADEVGLGVRPSESARFLVIASPAGNYFSGPLRPVSLWLSQEYVRAAPGGTGAAKTGGNYAALAARPAGGHRARLRPGRLPRRRRAALGRGARRHEHVLRARRRHDRDPRAVRLDPRGRHPRLAPHAGPRGSATPSRSAGSTSTSGARARPTAASSRSSPAAPPPSSPPSASLRWPGGEAVAGDGQPGPVTTKLRAALLDLQYGRTPDTHGWVHRVL